MSGGLSFLRTGFSNMVYSCPETVSDMYVNKGERLQKGRVEGREKGVGGPGRGVGGGEGRREEFAKMPSYGSLQQAVKVRPERGEGERRGKLSLPFQTYFCCKFRNVLHLVGDSQRFLLKSKLNFYSIEATFTTKPDRK